MSYWTRWRMQLIAKYNPYHDEKGKFASADGSTVATRMMTAIEKGGFTYDPGGKVPTKGFSVGVYPEKSTTIPVEEVTKDKVVSWMKNNTALLGQRGNMLGGWVDKGDLYLDIVKVFPPDQKEAAMSAGKEHNQLAIADLAIGITQSSIPVVMVRMVMPSRKRTNPILFWDHRTTSTSS